MNINVTGRAETISRGGLAEGEVAYTSVECPSSRTLCSDQGCYTGIIENE